MSSNIVYIIDELKAQEVINHSSLKGLITSVQWISNEEINKLCSYKIAEISLNTLSFSFIQKAQLIFENIEIISSEYMRCIIVKGLSEILSVEEVYSLLYSLIDRPINKISLIDNFLKPGLSQGIALLEFDSHQDAEKSLNNLSKRFSCSYYSNDIDSLLNNFTCAVKLFPVRFSFDSNQFSNLKAQLESIFEDNQVTKIRLYYDNIIILFEHNLSSEHLSILKNFYDNQFNSQINIIPVMIANNNPDNKYKDKPRTLPTLFNTEDKNNLNNLIIGRSDKIAELRKNAENEYYAYTDKIEAEKNNYLRKKQKLEDNDKYKEKDRSYKDERKQIDKYNENNSKERQKPREREKDSVKKEDKIKNDYKEDKSTEKSNNQDNVLNLLTLLLNKDKPQSQASQPVQQTQQNNNNILLNTILGLVNNKNDEESQKLQQQIKLISALNSSGLLNNNQSMINTLLEQVLSTSNKIVEKTPKQKSPMINVNQHSSPNEIKDNHVHSDGIKQPQYIPFNYTNPNIPIQNQSNMNPYMYSYNNPPINQPPQDQYFNQQYNQQQQRYFPPYDVNSNPYMPIQGNNIPQQNKNNSAYEYEQGQILDAQQLFMMSMNPMFYNQTNQPPPNQQYPK